MAGAGHLDGRCQPFNRNALFAMTNPLAVFIFAKIAGPSLLSFIYHVSNFHKRSKSPCVPTALSVSSKIMILMNLAVQICSLSPVIKSLIVISVNHEKAVSSAVTCVIFRFVLDALIFSSNIVKIENTSSILATFIP
ncbi:hypothetical protein WN943_025672 [Citrus x changshan-huyou]